MILELSSTEPGQAQRDAACTVLRKHLCTEDTNAVQEVELRGQVMISLEPLAACSDWKGVETQVFATPKLGVHLHPSLTWRSFPNSCLLLFSDPHTHAGAWATLHHTAHTTIHGIRLKKRRNSHSNYFHVWLLLQPFITGVLLIAIYLTVSWCQAFS